MQISLHKRVKNLEAVDTLSELILMLGQIDLHDAVGEFQIDVEIKKTAPA